MKRTSLTLQHVKTEAIKFAIMLLGTFILAFAYYHINFQNHLSEGGFVGLALLGKYATGLSPAIGMLLLDIPVMILAWFLKGWKFMIQALLGVGAFSLFYDGFERYSTLVMSFNGNLWIPAVLSGVLTGVGAGVVLRFGGATGGDDILAVLVSRWKGWKLGTVFFVSDAFVLGLSLFFLPVKETLYTILAVWIASKVITYVVSVPARGTVVTTSAVKLPMPSAAAKAVNAAAISQRTTVARGVSN
ncbi:YitT family protein [Paenibacillus sp. FSL H8-0079]|uniref:YitT family protein n=1 Tax=Paenibacillus sp. FSL H8-0079 TaxID=2921375 RepID=UPI0030ECFF55